MNSLPHEDGEILAVGPAVPKGMDYHRWRRQQREIFLDDPVFGNPRRNDISRWPQCPKGSFRQSNFDAYFNFTRNLEAEQNQRATSHRRRTSVKAAGEMFTLKEWLELCDRHDNCCARCKKPEILTVDHIQPVSKGGTNDIGNIQPLCRSCNSHKGVNDTDYRG